jgi:uncharacterized membrane protein YwzB
LHKFRKKIYLCSALNPTRMFEQVVANGANWFVIIVAVVVGFASAMGYVDYLRTNKKEEDSKH